MGLGWGALRFNPLEKLGKRKRIFQAFFLENAGGVGLGNLLTDSVHFTHTQTKTHTHTYMTLSYVDIASFMS